MGLVVSLILIGLVLMLAEVLIIPGVGVAGVLGLLSMGGSCWYAFNEFGNITGGGKISSKTNYNPTPYIPSALGALPSPAITYHAYEICYAKSSFSLRLGHTRGLRAI